MNETDDFLSLSLDLFSKRYARGKIARSLFCGPQP
ncbi:MAG: hypothetical protein FD153_439 [Rhodospirillaceae bacterium]|nr:MAG: hypothetical protein FD153_439 [Rhodospirillaceae bacterium]